MQSLSQPHPILHIHPTKRCNLRCLHCYSASSPEEQDTLTKELLLNAIADASQQGYTRASFSGGEPILYKPLLELLEQAHRCQMQTAVVSNGMLLDERRLEKLAGEIDLLVISLDGMADSHNRLRANPQAFETMVARLEGIRQAGLPFGFLFTITRQNFRELQWVINFALKQGASLLQIHPIEAVGRAKDYCSGSVLNQGISAYVYFQVIRLQETISDRLYLHLDLTHQEVFRTYPTLFFANQSIEENRGRAFGEILSPLIIEADGMVVPLQHGFARNYALGNLQDAPLPQLIDRWRDRCYPAFLKLCQQVYEEVTAPAPLPVMNWYQEIARRAQTSFNLIHQNL